MSEEELLRVLVRRIDSLEAEKLINEYRIIRLQQKQGELNDVEDALRVNKELASVADKYLKKKNFIQQFCDEYRFLKPKVDAIKDITEVVASVIAALYPYWMTDPVVLAMVASFGAAVILDKTINSYCELTAPL